MSSDRIFSATIQCLHCTFMRKGRLPFLPTPLSALLSMLTKQISDFEKRDVRKTSTETNCSPRQSIGMCVKQCDSLRDNCSQPVNPVTLTKRA